MLEGNLRIWRNNFQSYLAFFSFNSLFFLLTIIFFLSLPPCLPFVPHFKTWEGKFLLFLLLQSPSDISPLVYPEKSYLFLYYFERNKTMLCVVQILWQYFSSFKLQMTWGVRERVTGLSVALAVLSTVELPGSPESQVSLTGTDDQWQGQPVPDRSWLPL